MHKQIAESRNLTKSIKSLIEYLSSIQEEDKEDIPDHPRYKSWDCRYQRRSITRWIRIVCEKEHRQETKRLIHKAISDPDTDYIFSELERSQSWYW